ncbi:integrase [Synergistales bacterium]|nr:integrase [Synergistales bacterium]
MLTELQVKSAKPSNKPYMLRDDRGLYLEVAASGTKSWRMRYWIDKKEYKKSLGQYPLVSLKDAREKRDRIRLQILDGEDPAAKPEREPNAPTFAEVWAEWMEKKVEAALSPAYAQDLKERSNNHLLPFIGNMKIADVTSVDVLRVVRRIEALGHAHMAHRVCQICGQVFRYGIASGLCQGDPTGGIKGAMQTHIAQHQASITDPEEIGALLRAIDGYSGAVVRFAMMLQAYTFVRPGELRHAEWAEFGGAEWRIPAEKMKMKRIHIVPLSRQSVEILEGIKPLTGHGRYVFPSGRTPAGNRPMSENAVTAALRRMGYTGDDMTGHGFRSMASTLLNENSFKPDVIERQLAHIEGNSVRAAYNYAEYLPERREMMQWWADYLDGLKGSPAE